jgi:hypothetical protein
MVVGERWTGTDRLGAYTTMLCLLQARNRLCSRYSTNLPAAKSLIIALFLGMSYLAAVLLLYLEEMPAFIALANLLDRRVTMDFYGLQVLMLVAYPEMLCGLHCISATVSTSSIHAPIIC